MGKRKPAYGHDKDGFVELIPRVQNVAGCSIHEGQDSAEYWKNRCLHAESKYDSLKRSVNKTYGRQQPEPRRDADDEYLDSIDQFIADLDAELEQMDREKEEAMSSIEDEIERPFNIGLGLSFGPGKDPKLYRLSDRDGELRLREKFVGGEVEIQPGRGFHIGLHWRRD